jgi:hypothetical protein
MYEYWSSFAVQSDVRTVSWGPLCLLLAGTPVRVTLFPGLFNYCLKKFITRFPNTKNAGQVWKGLVMLICTLAIDFLL